MDNIKAYRILYPATHCVCIMHDIVFNEEQGWTWGKMVDHGLTSMTKDFIIDYVHFEGAEELADLLH